MADTVCSAVAGEAVQRLSLLLSGEGETGEMKVDRVEMAVLKLETIIAMSEDWQVTHTPLLRWKAKLKRVIKEGKGIIRSNKRNTGTLEELGMARSSSFPRRVARAAKRFMPFSRGTAPGDDLTDSAVRRFERIADGADGFFELVRCGGRPKTLMFLPSFARSLASGEAAELSLRMEGGTALRGGDGTTAAAACLWMSYEHDVAWEKNFKMMAAFRVSESLDTTRVAASCVELLPPQFGAAREAMKDLLAEMAVHGRNSPAPSAISPIYLPKKLSEQHEHVEPEQIRAGLLPTTADGLSYHDEAGGSFERGRQWWCPHSSTRLSVVPVSSPPKSVVQWCKGSWTFRGK
uniref:Rx N-terminal domain-containing protein n=1 Tax=Aegilops tauschii TaxID=37682 RepID=M8B6E3_AEGTA